MEARREGFGNVDSLRRSFSRASLSRRDVLRLAFAGVFVLGGPSVLQEREMEQRSDELRLVETYKPRVRGDIADVAVDARKLLLGIPGVVNVERFPAGEEPKRRIVHLLDWHWIPKELFLGEKEFVEERLATDEGYMRKRENVIVGKMKGSGVLILGGGHNLSDNVPPDCEYLRVETKAYGKCGATAEGARTQQEIDARYEEFLREVEAVQADQRVLLRCLAQYHGLQRVFQGEMQATLRSYQDLVEAVREYPDDQSFRETRLQIGAAGQLLAEGILKEVRAADNLSMMLEGMERKKEN